MDYYYGLTSDYSVYLSSELGNFQSIQDMIYKASNKNEYPI